MNSLQKKLHPPVKQLRQFGAVGFVVLGVWASWLAWSGAPAFFSLVLAVAALSLGLAGCFWPAGLRPIFAALMILATPFEWVVSTLVLGLIYFAVVTPLGLISRLVGRDPLGLRQDSQAVSFWRRRITAKHPQSYFRQF